MEYNIVGGGIGGLCLAIAFERLGIEYQVYERSAELGEVGAGIWLAPNALQVLDWLGLLSEVQAAGNPIKRITLADDQLRPLSDVPQDAVYDHFGCTTIAIHRARLQQILFDQLPAEKKHLGKELASFQQTESTVQLNFTDGTQTEAAFLIGADGIHSKVRQQLFPGRKIRHSGQTCWRGIADMNLDNAYRHRGMELWGDQTRIGISQVAEGQVYWFAVAANSAAIPSEPVIRKETLLARYQTFHPLIGEVLAATSPDRILENDILDLHPQGAWQEQRVCLLGDAAHATTPNMGQGGAQAIEDAYFLSQYIKTLGGEPAFEKFEQRRKPKVQRVVKQSWSTGQVAHWKQGRWLRNAMMRTIPNRVLQRQMLKLYQLEAL